MRPQDLPDWLKGFQALTWLATGEPDLVMGKRAVFRGNVRIQDSNKRPAESKATPAELRKVRTQMDLDYPDPWGGPSEQFLWTYCGDPKIVRKALGTLLSAARGGAVRTIDEKHCEPISPAVWGAHTLLHSWGPEAVLNMCSVDGRPIDIVPLFSRNVSASSLH